MIDLTDWKDETTAQDLIEMSMRQIQEKEKQRKAQIKMGLRTLNKLASNRRSSRR